MRISKHLNLAELTRSESAKRAGISNIPTKEHLNNLIVLAEKVFEPIREHFKVPIHISSGYRSKKLNNLIKGSSTSDHCFGRAIDIDMDGSDSEVTNKMVFDYIKNNLSYKQLINEFDYSWIHVSYDPKAGSKQKKEVLEAYKEKGKTKYRIFK